MGKQSDSWKAANFRSGIGGQKGPWSSYVRSDEVGKPPLLSSSPERRGKKRARGERIGGRKERKKREKAASKRPPSSIHPLSVSSGTVSKRWEHPLGPECVSFFPRAALSFPSFFSPHLYLLHSLSLSLSPKNPFHKCRIKRSRVRACT